MKWDSHFIAKHENRCALGGTRDTAVSRAEGRSSDDKGKVVTIDERSRIRPINNMDGRQHCMGMFFSASLQEEVLAFESAALRDEWISKLTVRVCMLFIHIMPLHNGAKLACRVFQLSPLRSSRPFQLRRPQCSRCSR